MMLELVSVSCEANLSQLEPISSILYPPIWISVLPAART